MKQAFIIIGLIQAWVSDLFITDNATRWSILGLIVALVFHIRSKDEHK